MSQPCRKLYLSGWLLLLLIIPAGRDARAAEKTQVPQAKESRRGDCYGDPLPAGAVVRMGTVRWHHGGNISSLAFSADGKTLISTSNDATARLWEVATGKELRRFQGPDKEVTLAVFSPDGKLAALGGSAGQVRIWDTRSGKEVCELAGRHEEGVSAIAFSPDGTLLASAGADARIRLWHVATGRLCYRIDNPKVKTSCLVFSSDGKLLASGGAGYRIRLWKVASGEEVLQFVAQPEGNGFVAFSKDVTKLISANSGRVTVWQADTGKEIRKLLEQKKEQERFARRLRNDNELTSFTLSPDGKILAVGQGDGWIKLLDLATGKEVSELKANASAVSSLAFSPDSKILATGERESGTIRLWEVATLKRLDPPRGHPGDVRSVAFVQHGKLLASLSDNQKIRLWETASGRLVRELEEEQGISWKLTTSPDGKLLVTWGKGMGLWDVGTGKLIRRLADSSVYPDHVIFSSDARLLFAANRDGVRVWEVATGKELRRVKLMREDRQALTVPEALAAGGKFLASTHRPMHGYPISLPSVEIWDAETGKLRQLEWHPGLISCLTFSPDGQSLATVGNDTIIHLWDVRTGKERRQFVGHQRPPGTLGFSPDGKTLASAGWNKTIRLWEVATGQERRQFLGHDSAVLALAFAQDGKTLASGSRDTTALFWDVTGLLQDGRLPTVHLQAKELEALWQDLKLADAAKAYRALWTLAVAPKESLPFLSVTLRPAATSDSQRMARLIADLDSERFTVREKATQELQKQGALAEPGLRQTLGAKPSLEVRTRVERLLQKLEKRPEPIPPPEELQALRAIEVLEHIGTVEAKQVLKALASGAEGARLTQEAKASLERLANRAAVTP